MDEDASGSFDASGTRGPFSLCLPFTSVCASAICYPAACHPLNADGGMVSGLPKAALLCSGFSTSREKL